MIGRFKYHDKVFFGTIQDDRVVVEKTLYCDTFSIDELQVLTPSIPSKIICVGLNYVDHARELNMTMPDHPILFLKPNSSVIGDGDRIIYPNVPADRAMDVILGYTCFNDVTARDIQKIDTQWTRAKSYDTFAPFGPYIAQPSDIDISDLFIRSRVNGKVKQDSNVNNMIFDVPVLIEFISHVMTLEKGDIIATGTPEGVGEMLPGDTVEIEIEGIGILKNQVIKDSL
jgi:2-keto-4-pentenoate hydratase/2-oxohepta-3-ene-1,7-dioic acid hydratase in catechol pathway